MIWWKGKSRRDYVGRGHKMAPSTCAASGHDWRHRMSTSAAITTSNRRNPATPITAEEIPAAAAAAVVAAVAEAPVVIPAEVPAAATTAPTSRWVVEVVEAEEWPVSEEAAPEAEAEAEMNVRISNVQLYLRHFVSI